MTNEDYGECEEAPTVQMLDARFLVRSVHVRQGILFLSHRFSLHVRFCGYPTAGG